MPITKSRGLLHATQVSFSIASYEDVAPEQITALLGIQPDRFRRKGDLMEGEYTRNRRHCRNVWSIDSTERIQEKVDISPHLTQLQVRLESKRDLLDHYTTDPRCECMLCIRVQTNNPVYTLTLTEAEIQWIRSIGVPIFGCSVLYIDPTDEKIDNGWSLW